VVTMVLLYGDNVCPPDRKGQAIPTHQTTSPKVTVSQVILASFGEHGNLRTPNKTAR
jgi:hypothetical protein